MTSDLNADRSTLATGQLMAVKNSLEAIAKHLREGNPNKALVAVEALRFTVDGTIRDLDGMVARRFREHLDAIENIRKLGQV